MNLRRKVSLVVVALVFHSAAGGVAVPDSLRDRWVVGIRHLVKQNGIPGMSVALVDRDRIIWSEGFGCSTGRGSAPVNGSTLFSIQSISKSVTATAVLLAVQDGLVDLDAPITSYLPDFTVNSCFEEHPESKITLRLLLTHAAGLTHEPPVGNNYDCPFSSYEAHNWSIRDTWLNSPVGTRYSYSNNGYDLAAEAVARASGMAFPEFVRQRLFAPLGMSSTTLDAAAALRSSNRADGHAFGLSRIPDVMPFPGAGNVFASANDLARFVQFHLNLGRAGGRQLLRQALLAEMYRPSIVPEYGMGVAIIDQDGKPVLNHNGGGFGWQASMTWYPRYGIGCVILADAQTDADLYGATVAILDDWARTTGVDSARGAFPFDPIAIGRSLAPAPAKPPRCIGDTLFQPRWQKYEGTYRLRFGPGFEFAWYARLARFFGFRVAQVEVRHRGWGLDFRISYGSGYGDWQVLTEYRPGLFFTEYGEALDLRGDQPTYRNLKLER